MPPAPTSASLAADLYPSFSPAGTPALEVLGIGSLIDSASRFERQPRLYPVGG